jgi:signal recognition particle GTPase
MTSRKQEALAAVVAATEGAVALDEFYPGSQAHRAVGRGDVGTAVAAARAAGATDDEIRRAVKDRAFM